MADWRRTLPRAAFGVLVVLVLGLVGRPIRAATPTSAELARHLHTHPQDIAAWNAYGVRQAEAGDLIGAIRTWRHAVDLNPRYIHLYNNIGSALRRLGHPREAAAWFMAGLRLERTYWLWFNLGLLYEDTHQWEAAANCYRQALERKGDFTPARQRLPYVLTRLDTAAHLARSTAQPPADAGIETEGGLTGAAPPGQHTAQGATRPLRVQTPSPAGLKPPVHVPSAKTDSSLSRIELSQAPSRATPSPQALIEPPRSVPRAGQSSGDQIMPSQGTSKSGRPSREPTESPQTAFRASQSSGDQRDRLHVAARPEPTRPPSEPGRRTTAPASKRVTTGAPGPRPPESAPGRSESAAAELVPLKLPNDEGGQMFLTFDGGAGDKGCRPILEALRTAGVHSTFFLTGKWVKQYPDLARRILAEGHEIANHSFSHPNMKQMAAAKIAAEIAKAEEAFTAVLGRRGAPYFRFPYGAQNRRVEAIVEGLGYRPVYWHIDTIDWKEPPVATILDRVRRKLRRGAVVLMHLGSRNGAKALPEILQLVRSRGYHPVRLSDLDPTQIAGLPAH